MDSGSLVATDAQSFCRQARRLRAALGTDPVRMHRQLGRLSIKPAGAGLATVWRRVDTVDPPTQVSGFSPTTDRSFREYVERRLAGRYRDVLRYSERVEMLEEAGGRGIGRFDANLIIASVQHRLEMGSGERGGDSRSRVFLGGVIVFLAVQGLILLGYWRLFHR